MRFSIQFLVPFLLSLSSQATAASSDLEVAVGHHVIFSYAGVEPPTKLLDLITAGKLGGVILFGENVNDNLAATVDSLQATYAQSPYYSGSPLFIMTDQEGGKVRRLPGGPEQSAKEVGQSANPEAAATQMGKDAATVLSKYKNNVNLAPVLDVYHEEGDFADNYGRSFSNSATVVGTCGAAFINAQQSARVVAAAKHFPGLGGADTNDNTDETPVTIDRTIEQLRKIDMAPYRNAIAAGVDMVMTSWAIYPDLDAKNPAGLSRSIVQNELRGRLGFQGVTITDAIEAGGLTGFGDAANRSLLAAQAGVDILLASARDVTQGESVFDALLAALRDGSLDSDEFSAATERILKVRKKLA